MQANEHPVNFVRRVFSLVFEGDSLSKAVRGVRDFFAFDFVLDSDGRSLNRSDFEATLLAQRSRNPKYPPRFPVEDAKVSWKVPWPEYSPVPFVAPSVLAAERSDTNPNGWADSPRPNLAELKHRLSCEGPLFFDADQRPVNPRGRTGVCGRGMLGKWGPNRAADPIVTRWKPGDKRKLQIVAIQRGDTGVWALPGGMVDAGEVVSVTVRREFAEEAGNMASDAERAAFNAAVDELFATA
ncbi:hypothetical protein EMIHUDRAFT_249179, partial [Emiliania huxleyi CCMP1516]|uniref:Nudix hydrolase domain-containing protein n=2 Tax=Emiliania huxleyi TaxID=2903 RepID=A0A0D3IAH7_EMIH1